MHQAIELQHKLTLADGLWIGKHPDLPQQVSCNDYRQYLGREYSNLVINCFSGVRANTLLALSGVVTAGGLMIVLCPELDQWHQHSDPESKNRTSFGYESEENPNYFIQWIVQNIKSDQQVVVTSPTNFVGNNVLLTVHLPTNTPPHSTQDYAVQKIIDLFHSSSPGYLVISADRGRGKSSALGIAAGHILRTNKANLVVTSVSPKMVENVFKHAALTTQAPLDRQNKLHLGDSCLSHLPPDVVTLESPNNDLLFIDEAAALPAQTLESFVANNDKCIFSTTLHGYEGSGRGFELRFKQQLQAIGDCESIVLTQPMRWSEGDPLESFWHSTMLVGKPTPTPELAANGFTISEFTSSQLLENPHILQQSFQLLIDAHYQTTPDDLMRLLNAAEQKLLVLLIQDVVIAVCLVAIEGGQRLHCIAEDIHKGKRRPNGHLTAQTLSYSYAMQELATLQYMRIVRIAVVHNYQTKGFGTRLLEYCCESAKQLGLDFLSSSFGVTDYLYRFWTTNNFHIVKLGLKKDAASGEYSGVFLNPLQKKSSIYLNNLKQMFLTYYHYNRPTYLTYLPKATRKALDTITQVSETSTLSHDVVNQAYYLSRQVISGDRPLNSCQFALEIVLKDKLPSSDTTDIDICFLQDLIEKQLPNKTLCRHYNLSGKKHIQSTARINFAKLLNIEF